ncbi:MAG TPA: hypothetical protein VL738_41110 [Dactylosporangium sp.]|nr:hypothetical protein [Dactylosporangium sp.]
MSRPAAVAVAALSLAVLAAADPAWAGAPTGTVTAQIAFSGGPAPGLLPGMPGTVTLSRDGRVFAARNLGEGESLRAELPAGAYHARAHSGDALCIDETVHVTAGGTSALCLVCQVK